MYILKSLKNNKLYTGYTSDLKHRFEEHNSLVGGSYTSKNAPFKIMYYECFLNKKDALMEEKFLKSGKGRDSLKLRLKYTLHCPVV